jgi:hypothetical protein
MNSPTVRVAKGTAIRAGRRASLGTATAAAKVI